MQLRQLLITIAVSLFICSELLAAKGKPIGSATNPLKVSMIPGAKEGKQAIKNVKPIYDTITDEFEIHFKLSYGESHEAVIEAFCDQQIQLALFDTYTYGEVRKKCHNIGEILAAEVDDGSSSYYFGIFVRRGSHLNTLKDLTGKNIALGGQHSTSSFDFPVSMLIGAGINPGNDLEHIFVTGSHFSSVEALLTGKAIAAATYFMNWRKAVHEGRVDPLYFKPLAKSIPIPNNQFVMNKNLPKTLKTKLREAFHVIHAALSPDKLLSVDGHKIDRYDVDIGTQIYIDTLNALEVVTDEVKKSILEKANQH